MVNKVSIITVCHNSAETIRDTIESVINQDYQSIEYIIVDGDSTDGTMDIIREYGEKIDIVISEPDKGIYDAMNKGIRVASGNVVGTINSDDFYASSSSISQLIKCMDKSGSDTVYSDLVVVDAKDTNKILRYYNSGAFHPDRLRYGWMPAHPTFMVKRDLYLKYGVYKTDYKIAADYEMVVRLLHTAGASYTYLPIVVVKMRKGGASTRGLKSSWILNKEIVRACRSNGIETSLFKLVPKIPIKLMEYFRRPK